SSSTQAISVPAIPANTTWIMHDDYPDGKEWVAPDPDWYISDGLQFTPDQHPVLCMLARLVNSTDNIDEPGTLPYEVAFYADENNNVVMRNTFLSTLAGFKVTNGTGWDFGWSTVLLNNSSGGTETVTVKLDLLTEDTDADEPFDTYGTIYIAFDEAKWTEWYQAGALGTGFELVEEEQQVVPGIVRVTDYANVALEGITVNTTDNIVFGVKFSYDEQAHINTPPTGIYTYAYQLSAASGPSDLTGSNTILFATVEPLPPSPMPLLSVNKATPGQATIYPNPFGNGTSALIEVASPGQYTVKITDIMGRTVDVLCENSTMQAGKHRFEIDGAKYVPGIYFVTIFDGQSQQTIRIVKQ
ncbi:MAG TPA: T9SS type A sorting domain-containing protein, partial [Bacteroidia bacterium]|nr:T9SS type A sorting domain-containing protein [Bacteroidia bacterium]